VDRPPSHQIDRSRYHDRVVRSTLGQHALRRRSCTRVRESARKTTAADSPVRADAWAVVPPENSNPYVTAMQAAQDSVAPRCYRSAAREVRHVLVQREAGPNLAVIRSFAASKSRLSTVSNLRPVDCWRGSQMKPPPRIHPGGDRFARHKRGRFWYADGVAFNGRRYRSLSQVAREITGESLGGTAVLRPEVRASSSMRARPSRNSRDIWRLNSELKLWCRAMGYPPISALDRSNPAGVSCPTFWGWRQPWVTFAPAATALLVVRARK
jgi:hypothetical protein